MKEMIMSHWHVEYGITGYGPGCGEEQAAFDLDELPGVIFDELDGDLEQAFDSIVTAREHNDREEMTAWWDKWRELEALRPAFDPARAKAPLYRANIPAWHSTVLALVGQHFPLALDPGDTRRLYVWECDCGE